MCSIDFLFCANVEMCNSPTYGDTIFFCKEDVERTAKSKSQQNVPAEVPQERVAFYRTR
jgi:hypothetical protein